MKKNGLLLLLLSLVTIVFSQEEVQYVVTSDKNGFDVTYFNTQGGIEQKKISTNYWAKTIIGDVNTIINLDIIAQTNSSSANISVKIFYHNKLWAEANSYGDYVIVSIHRKEFYLYKDIHINNPYQQNFSGNMHTYSFAPILDKPNILTSTQIGSVINNSVNIIEKYNDEYYKIDSNGVIGYLWSGWFTL